jgi:hypothetical protein
MHTLYCGPSWAVQSFETPTGDNDTVKTNLAQELELTDYTSLAQYACSNLEQLQRAQNFISQHPELAPFRIIFVTANTLQDGYKTLGVSRVDFAKSFLISNDPAVIVKSLEQDFYQQLNALDVPVALIGAHTDVTCESHDNITVIHPSWQNFLAQQCDELHFSQKRFYGWPAEIANLWLQGAYIPERGPPAKFDLGANPSHEVVFFIDRTLSHWTTMEKNNLFRGVHPNIRGNQLFAQEIKQSVNNWLDKHQ